MNKKNISSDNQIQNSTDMSLKTSPTNKQTINNSKSSSVNFHPDIPRRSMEIPGTTKLVEHGLSMSADDNQLTVGRNIALSGKINACEKLIVQGTVEATLNKATAIEVAHGGFFKGKAEVLEAKISGNFEGTLTAKELLVIHKGGHIEGSVRYGRIIIESGGEITGDMASLEEIEKNNNKK